MTFVGKMLVVVQVIMSLAFMAFAGAVFATHQNWKTQAESLESQLTAAQTEIQDRTSELQRRLDEATQIRDQAQQRAEQAEGQNSQLRTQLANETQKSNRLELELRSQTGLAQAKSDEATFRDDEAQRQRIAYQTLRDQNNQLAETLRDRDDQIFSLNLSVEDLTKRHNSLLGENGDLKKILRLNGLPSDPTTYAALEEPPPPVEGLVVATQRDRTNRTEFVEVSIGSDDGLLKNHVLDVFSSAAVSGKTQYLGKIEIVYVTNDRAVGRVIETAKNGIIQRGDNVTTKL
jgi:hypothetical protein